MLKETEIRQLIDEIVLGYQPEKIYLFGSYANGTPTEDSDLDLFIIKKTNTRKIHRDSEVRRLFKKYPPIGMDIIIYTPDELLMGMNDVVNIGKEAVTTGKLLYERI